MIPSDPIKALSLGELDRCLAWLEEQRTDEGNYIRDYLIFLLFCDAGLRVAELCSLRLATLHFNSIAVRHLDLPAAICKNNRPRTVPLTKRAIGCLSVYLRENKARMLKDGEWAFPSPQRAIDHITPRAIQYMISNVGAQALERNLHPHSLRHTYATRLMRVCDLRTVQELLGHANVSSTQIYTHPNLDDLGQAVDKMA